MRRRSILQAAAGGALWATASDPRGTTPPGPTPPPAAAGTVQVSLGTPSPASAGVTHISPYLFGAGTEGLCYPGNNSYCAAVNPGWQATYQQQNWRLFRVNCEATANDWIANSTSRRNFANGFKTFWQNETPANPYVGNRLVFTVGSQSPDNFGPTECLTIANFFISIGMECFYWEIWNEPDAGMNGNGWASNFVACRNALKALNPLYQVGGPTVAYPNTGYFNEAKAAGADFCSFHWYPTGSPGALSGAALYSTGLTSGTSHVQIIQNSNFGANAPIFLGEWSIGWESGGDPADQTIDGALFVNNYLYGAMTAPNSKVEMSAIWTIGENTGFTFVTNDGSNVRPRGQVLGKLGRTMGGPRVLTTVGSGMPHLLAMASATGSNWAVWLTNYDTSADYTINLQGLTGATYQYWECSPAHGVPLTNTNPASRLANLTIPSRSIVVLSNV